MKIKQTIKLLVAVIALVGLLSITVQPTVSAVTTCPNGGDPNNNCSLTGGQTSSSAVSGPSDTAATSNGCDYKGAILQGGDLCNNSQKSAVWGILLLVINILTAGVGIAAAGGLIYGAILWSAAGGNPGQVQKARQIVTNVVIGIIAYAAMYSFLNFLVPGGIFN